MSWIMKLSCYNKIIIMMMLAMQVAFGSLSDKSAMVYYGEDISYPMVGIHDYIIVQPNHIDTNTHGFSVYKDKMYAYVSVGEIDKDGAYYNKINKAWIAGENKPWHAAVMDITNEAYQNFLFDTVIQPEVEKGFKNFFFDTLDSYEIVSKTPEQKARSKQALIAFIKRFHDTYPKAKLIINRGFELLDAVHSDITAVLFESYYKGLGGKDLHYQDVSDADRTWLDAQIQKVKSYHLDVIDVDYLSFQDRDQADALVAKIKAKGMIPYISNKDLTRYGRSSKNALKREILTLIDEKQKDRIELAAHQVGALPLEYMGYIEKMRDIDERGLPKLEDMGQYAGVIVWLRDAYKNPQELIDWAKSLQHIGVKVVFVDNFGVNLSRNILNPLGISISRVGVDPIQKNKIIFQDPMMGFEVAPTKNIGYYLNPSDARALLVLEDEKQEKTTQAAITPWGGYAVGDAWMVDLNQDNIWVMNPFKFFKEALRLKTLIVPDPTTENGNRILYSHVDGDAFMNRVEWNPKLFSAQIIYRDILKRYAIPHSISIVGAEIEPDGLYPKLSPELMKIAKKIYALPNVEGASHTFSHPFYWEKIHNQTLAPQYRLDPKGYTFSYEREMLGTIKMINTKLMPPSKPKDRLARTIFWTGDCVPSESDLAYVYQHHLLNLNGGDTYITNDAPWLSYIAPFGIRRGHYYQIYTGAQDENVYTNDWRGPFWGFKKVVQTFKLTNSPRRFKPIDIYYHYYSGSKRASLNALKYAFDWAMKQDTTPLFASDYIPKVMDFYTVSLAEEAGAWKVSGMRDLHTLREEKRGAGVDFEASKDIIGVKHFESHTYFHTANTPSVLLKPIDKIQNKPYLIDANAPLVSYDVSKKKQVFHFKGYVGLKLHFNLPAACQITSKPKASKIIRKQNDVKLYYNNKKEAQIDVVCK
ncbi:endo alpha-1,4 polygalactosaminidase [Sulfurospirillum sp. 1612]|uniref:endo alpha-1,4 polygalactosaminidase n=1 Tax=Sulfurospirillum sp. 1612 TaxID=3094835 RepID=UPI002F936A3D